ncbi:MAG: ABC transporter ATP-binding protein [Myxococcota bacterium]|nr:ABC transporter ATP-binding protein [Myxococcota bacterium]
MAGDRAALIELERVTKVYGAGEAEVRALDGVDLRIDEGELVAFMGASGSGKSTCMNVLGCLDTVSSGSYRFRGVDVGMLDRDQRAKLRRLYLGFVFQGFNLLPRTSALENVELPLLYRGVAAGERRARAIDALTKVGLATRVQHAPSELSGGQQQRVAIARALVSDPDVILADEPTGNLDSRTSREILDLLVELHETRGIAIVMITHEPSMAAAAQRIVRFVDGRIAEDREVAADEREHERAELSR